MTEQKNINKFNNSNNESVDNKNVKTFTVLYSSICDYNNSASCDNNSTEVVNECIAKEMKKNCDLNIRTSNSQKSSSLSCATPRPSLIIQRRLPDLGKSNTGEKAMGHQGIYF